jgi:hypothetical protein
MVARRIVTLAVSFCLVLAVGIARFDRAFAQDEVKKAAQTPPPGKEAATPDVPQKSAEKSEAAKPADAGKTPDAAKKEETKAVEPPLPPIPPAVQAKLEAARKAVAEAIVACQDAGLVETSIDPPPILDILITGRALDKQKFKGSKPYAVNPEVFGAWFTGWSRKDMEGINYNEDVRIVTPSDGLKNWYDQRAHMLEQLIQDIRKTKGPAPAATKEAPKPAESAKPAAPPTTDTVKKAAEPKK